MSSGPDFIDQSRRLADYVDRILKGATPAGDLAIEQPTKFPGDHQSQDGEALGLTIPQSLLLSAEAIE